MLIHELRTDSSNSVTGLGDLDKVLQDSADRLLRTSPRWRNLFMLLADTCIALRRLVYDLERARTIVCPLDFSELYDFGHGKTAGRRAQLTPLLAHVITETDLPLAIPPASLHEMAAFLHARAWRIGSIGYGRRLRLRRRCAAYLSLLETADQRKVPAAADALIVEVLLLDPTTRHATVGTAARELLVAIEGKRFQSLSWELDEAHELYQTAPIQEAYRSVFDQLSQLRETKSRVANHADARNLVDTLVLNESSAQAGGQYYALITRAITLRVCDTVRWWNDRQFDAPVSRSAIYMYYLSRVREKAIPAARVGEMHREHLSLLVEFTRTLLSTAPAARAERDLLLQVDALRFLGGEVIARQLDAFADIEGRRLVSREEVERVMAVLDDQGTFSGAVEEAREDLRMWAARLLAVGARFASEFDRSGLNSDYTKLLNWVEGVRD